MNSLRKQWSQGNSGILYILTVFFTLVIASVISLIVDKLIIDKYIKGIINTAVLYALIFITLICYTNKKEYKLFEKSNFKARIDIPNIFVLLLIAISSIFFFLPLNNLFLKILEVTGYKIVLSEPVNTIPKVILSSIFLCVVPSIIEELVYRNAIFNGLKNDYSTRTSILICSLMFALFHMNGAQFIYQILMGIILCSTVVILENLTASMILHFFNNFIVVITVYFLGDSEVAVNLNGAFAVKAILMAVAGVIIIAALLIAAYIIRKIRGKDYVKGSFNIKTALSELNVLFIKKNNDSTITFVPEERTLFIMSFSAIIILWIINFVLGYVNL